MKFPGYFRKISKLYIFGIYLNVLFVFLCFYEESTHKTDVAFDTAGLPVRRPLCHKGIIKYTRDWYTL